MTRLATKTALVTGASRGIGRAIAIAFAEQGARVVVNYARRVEEAQQTARQILDVGGAAPVLKQFDVGDAKAVEDAFAQISKEIGGIDILVNNAGISIDGLLARAKVEDWQAVMRTNLDGAFFCAKACVRHMMKSRWGRIVNVSSVVGEMGNAGQVAYCSAKAGLIGMTKALARELGSRNITVNAVTPGFIETDMTSSFDNATREQLLQNIPLGCVGTVDDVAKAVTYLATDDARYITGHVLAINGGMYI